MGVIKKIDISVIEDGLKEIAGLSFQAKLFQEEYEDVTNQIKNNKSGFSSGNISKDVYEKNKVILENERKKLVKKISDIIGKMQRVNENIQNLIKVNRI